MNTDQRVAKELEAVAAEVKRGELIPVPRMVLGELLMMADEQLGEYHDDRGQR